MQSWQEAAIVIYRPLIKHRVQVLCLPEKWSSESKSLKETKKIHQSLLEVANRGHNKFRLQTLDCTHLHKEQRVMCMDA